MTENVSGASYAAADVNVEVGDRAVELFALITRKTTHPKVHGGLGDFTGPSALGSYEKPLLTASSDGVGTKLAAAQAVGKHDTIDLDLVIMVIGDLVVCDAEPLFLQDYIAIGKVVPEHAAEIISDIAEGCVQVDCALLGDETAKHPGAMEPDEYDASATGVGVMEEDELLGSDRVREDDVIIAMESSGLHPNGYSLARYVLLEKTDLKLDGYVEDFGHTLDEELLKPIKIYAKDYLALMNETEVRAFCHTTGDGLAGSIVRIIPEGLTAGMSRVIRTLGPIFKTIAELGNVSREEMEKTFNMGVGMVAIASVEDRDRALALLAARHINAWELGTARKGEAGKDGAASRDSHQRF